MGFRGGHEDRGALAAADGEGLGPRAGRGAEGALGVKGRDAEPLVGHAVEGAQAGDGAGPALPAGVGELGAVAEHEVGGGVGVDDAVLADGEEAGRVGAEGERGDAPRAPGVRGRHGGDGEGHVVGLVAPLDVARVPELDAGVGLGAREQEVAPRAGEPLQRRDRGAARLARALVAALDGVGRLAVDGVEARVAGLGARGGEGARGQGRAAEVPYLDLPVPVRGREDAAVGHAGLELDLPHGIPVAAGEVDGGGLGHGVDDLAGAVAAGRREAEVVFGEVHVHDGVLVDLPGPGQVPLVTRGLRLAEPVDEAGLVADHGAQVPDVSAAGEGEGDRRRPAVVDAPGPVGAVAVVGRGRHAPVVVGGGRASPDRGPREAVLAVEETRLETLVSKLTYRPVFVVLGGLGSVNIWIETCSGGEQCIAYLDEGALRRRYTDGLLGRAALS